MRPDCPDYQEQQAERWPFNHLVCAHWRGGSFCALQQVCRWRTWWFPEHTPEEKALLAFKEKPS